ncbi:hypothetical protein NEFER03_2142 [Nematocida sp. LUAm3]|nr:hypothetical protein NEFER03_2142 [Nematocida sp. LUAm3]KAI5174613.1 hypothetical protein NEFER02_0734 [Nematocida sp. LUAm2]KAI5177981.1 hypothetical protein NEFER01_1163 [Nematocida sp. LUAm1]
MFKSKDSSWRPFLLLCIILQLLECILSSSRNTKSSNPTNKYPLPVFSLNNPKNVASSQLGTSSAKKSLPSSLSKSPPAPSKGKIDLSDLANDLPEGNLPGGSSKQKKSSSSDDENEPAPAPKPASSPSFFSSDIFKTILICVLAVVGVLGLISFLIACISRSIAQRSRRLRYMEALQNSTYTRKGDGYDNYREVLE